jgi:guanylate kinase
VFVVSSPSGGGKTTVVDRLLRAVPRLSRSVSVTTRPPRPGERDGYHYRFVTPAAFRRLRRGRRLLEWANVHGACYGTPRGPVVRSLARGRHVVLCIDVQGARQVRRALGRRAVLVFLLPPSMRRLRARLLRRRTESPAALRRRLAAARREIACARWYDYAVVNDRLDRTVRAMQAIVTGQLGAQRKEQPIHGASAD